MRMYGIDCNPYAFARFQDFFHFPSLFRSLARSLVDSGSLDVRSTGYYVSVSHGSSHFSAAPIAAVDHSESERAKSGSKGCKGERERYIGEGGREGCFQQTTMLSVLFLLPQFIFLACSELVINDFTEETKLDDLTPLANLFTFDQQQT